MKDKNNSVISTDNSIDIDNVICSYVDQYKYFSPEARNFIEDNFIKKTGEGAFNGVIFGINRFEIIDGKIFLDYEKSDYKTYLASRDKEYKLYIKG